MIRALRRLNFRAATLLVAAAAALAGCGWAEWPPPGRGPRLSAPPPGAPGRSDPVFVNASSVIVGPGDSVFELARRHNVPVRAIIEANGLTPPYVLQPGRRIVLPRAAEYEVRAGDTLYAISRRFGVDTYALARLNGLEAPYLIRVGQRLRVPVAATADAGASPAPAKVESVPPSFEPPPASDPNAGTGVASAAPEPPPSPASAAAAPSSDGSAAQAAGEGAGPVSASGFIWPVRGRLLSAYGPKARGLHNDGINVAAPRGAPVRAAGNGVVAYAGSELKGFGNLLLIKHDNGWVSAYAHNDELLVKAGDRVSRGQVIARVGSTGNVADPQLHFELRHGKVAVNPLEHLPKGA